METESEIQLPEEVIPGGLQVRQEDTVRDDLDYFQEKVAQILKIPRRWMDSFSNIDIKADLKI